eukprot:Skav207216  [mRNA]  locus=scaffold1244:142524:147408:+ [translate_table: standard]
MPFGSDPDIHCFSRSPPAEMQPQYSFQSQSGQVISPWPYQSGQAIVGRQAVQGAPVYFQAAGAPVVNPMAPLSTPRPPAQPVTLVQAGGVVPGATYAQAPVTLPATTLHEAKVRTAADCALGPSEAMKRLREGFGQPVRNTS